jgi:hypothetical protein
MPRKGRDTTFDSLVDELHASTQWRKFKLDKGVFRPQSFEIGSKLMIRYRLWVERYAVEKIVAEALAEIATVDFQPENSPLKARDHFLSFALSPPAKIKLAKVPWGMTELLASTIAGATNRTIEEKFMRVEMHLVRDSVRAFNAFAREEVDKTGFALLLSADETVVSKKSLVGCIASL